MFNNCQIFGVYDIMWREVKMELIKANWAKCDLEEFDKWIMTLKGEDKDCQWEQRIVNTKLECYGRTSAKAKDIVKELKKGNYLDFLTIVNIKTHLHSIVCAYLINEIKDYEVYKKFLDKFVQTIDNWASSDVLKFKNVSTENLKAISKEYITREYLFVRRTAINVWFEIIKRNGVTSEVFDLLDGLKNESEYYVNMCGAWLLAECMVKDRLATLEYFKNNNTNKFVINKAISKCRDSYRISVVDKEYIKKFKK